MHLFETVSFLDDDQPVPLDRVRELVKETTRKLGSIPDLFLIHNPFVARPGELKQVWNILEDLKMKGKLKSIGVSNFRPQDLNLVLKNARYTPVVNQVREKVAVRHSDRTFKNLGQLEYHPYVLAHLEPVLELQAKHGILTEAYGPLTPILRHPTGGPLKPVLQRIARRLSEEMATNINEATVLLLWTRAQGVIGVTSSANVKHINELAAVYTMPELLSKNEIEEITRVGKTIHFRYYVSCWNRL